MATAKEPIEHKDKLGRSINVGDCVAYPTMNSLEIGVVKKLNPKMIKVCKVPNKSRRPTDGKNKYPHDMVKLDGPEITMWLLKNGN
jgi:hypothetical protein